MTGTRDTARKQRGIVPIADCLSELLSRKNFARVQSDSLLQGAWREAVRQAALQTAGGAGIAGAMAAASRPASVRAGKLEIVVANSTLLQELTFRSQELLSALKRQLPQLALTGLRFRVGPVHSASRMPGSPSSRS